jgi:hypothetical protein
MGNLRALGCGVQGVGFRCSGFRVQDEGVDVWGSWFRVSGSGFGVQGSWF